MSWFHGRDDILRGSNCQALHSCFNALVAAKVVNRKIFLGFNFESDKLAAHDFEPDRACGHHQGFPL